jgi:ribose 5-phosphate isomerase B
MRVLIAADHAGFEVKEMVKKELEQKEYIIIDFGCDSKESCDYPDYAHELCQNMNDEEDIGILICGSGVGMSIVANRYPHVRCALCTDIDTALMSRIHNNANVLALGARNGDIHLLVHMVICFLNKPVIMEDRHLRRIEKINNGLDIKSMEKDNN